MRVILLFSVLLYSSASFGCDLCGCGANGSSWGIMPRQQSHFIGLRSQYRLFENEDPPSAPETSSFLLGEDRFLRMDLSGRYVWNEKFQLLASVPYLINQHQEGEHVQRKNGWGDVSLTALYMLIAPRCDTWSHALQFGAGVKAPTAKFSFSHEVPSAMQPGTGTWDFLTGVNYTLRHNQQGLNLELWRRFNGTTSEGFAWGDHSTGSMRLFHSIDLDSLTTLLPWAGISFDHYEANIENTKYDIQEAYSGGEMWNAQGGMEYFGKDFACGAEVGLPLQSTLAKGYSHMKIQVGFRFIVFIQSNKQHSTNK